jgi:hypothetical protein
MFKNSYFTLSDDKLVPKTSPYNGLPNSSTGGFPQPPAWYPNEQLLFFRLIFKKYNLSLNYYNFFTSGIGAFNPGIFKLGYDGGGPYLCIAINQGGGTLSAFGPVGIPSAILNSSVKFPGFFSLSFVSNSFPFKIICIGTI